MVKINRTAYENHNVQTLKKAVPPLSWDKNKPFSWNISINGRGFDIREKILPALLEATKKHCSFCDYYPLTQDFFPVSIEHFEPKSSNPDKAYLWDNLFPCCNGCTEKKRERFDERLLRPDEDTYSFEVYFTITGEGRLECKKKEKESRASITIDIYKLNRGALISERKKWIENFPKIQPDDPDDYPFRFIIPIVCNGQTNDDIINNYIA